MTASRQFWLIAAVATVALTVGAWLGWSRLAAESAAPVPQAALDALLRTEFKDLNGKPVHLTQFAGQTLIVNFWATWCAPCKEEMPDLVRFQSRYADKSVQIVGIGIDSVDNMQAFAKSITMNYPLLTGTGASISLTRALGNVTGALPYTLVLDGGGKTKFVKLGRISTEELGRAVARQP